MPSHRIIKLVLFIFVLPLFFMSGLTACDNEVSARDTVSRDGVLFLKGDDDPFSGFVVGKSSEGYRTQTCTFRKEYKDGILEGVTSFWYLNGKLESTTPYKDGKAHGYMIRYWDNGKPKSRIHFQNGLRGGTRGEMFWDRSGRKVRS
jgi:hypothetical protein